MRRQRLLVWFSPTIKVKVKSPLKAHSSGLEASDIDIISLSDSNAENIISRYIFSYYTPISALI